MGNYENMRKLNEIRKRMDEGDFITSLKILETLKLKKIKKANDLCLIIEVYIQSGHYEEAMELLQNLYQKNKTRKILYQMVNLSIKLRNIEEAERYLQEYKEANPKDSDQYMFRYIVDKLKGESYDRLIESLQKLKKIDYTEQWAYELAKVYYKAGMEQECIQECSDLILFFGEGVYVEKAKLLKAYYSGEVDKQGIMDTLKKRDIEIKNINNKEEYK